MADQALSEILHKQNDALWDVIALLEASIATLEADGQQPGLKRLARLAMEKVGNVQEALQAIV